MQAGSRAFKLTQPADKQKVDYFMNISIWTPSLLTPPGRPWGESVSLKASGDSHVPCSLWWTKEHPFCSPPLHLEVLCAGQVGKPLGKSIHSPLCVFPWKALILRLDQGSRDYSWPIISLSWIPSHRIISRHVSTHLHLEVHWTFDFESSSEMMV